MSKGSNFSIFCCICTSHEIGEEVATFLKKRLIDKYGSDFPIKMDWDITTDKDRIDTICDNFKRSKYCFFIFTQGCRQNRDFETCWKHADQYRLKGLTNVIGIRVEPFRQDELPATMQNLHKPLSFRTNFKDDDEKWKKVLECLSPDNVLTSGSPMPDNPPESMTSKWRNFLWSQYDLFGSSSSPSEYEDTLISKKLLSRDEREDYESKPRGKQVRSILDTMTLKGDREIKEFLKVIENKERYLMTMLKKQMTDELIADYEGKSLPIPSQTQTLQQAMVSPIKENPPVQAVSDDEGSISPAENLEQTSVNVVDSASAPTAQSPEKGSIGNIVSKMETLMISPLHPPKEKAGGDCPDGGEEHLFCWECGKPLKCPNAKFCTKCGTKQ